MTTEADVEQARVRVRNLIASQVVSLNEQEALEVLLSAAMEGLKVPRLKARARVLKARLPDGMKKCTIVFKSCPLGHGRLIAKNWIDDGCQTCALRKAESERDALRAQVERAAQSHFNLAEFVLTGEYADEARRMGETFRAALSALSATKNK